MVSLASTLASDLAHLVESVNMADRISKFAGYPVDNLTRSDAERRIKRMAFSNESNYKLSKIYSAV